MASAIQLDFLEEQTEQLFINKKIDAVDAKLNNVQRGLFARHNNLEKLYLEQKVEIEALKRQFEILLRNK